MTSSQAPLNGQKGASWVVFSRGAPQIVGSAPGLKKQLHMSVARWLCSGHPSERSAWLDGRVRVLLTPARCADLPRPAREAGQHWQRRRAKSTQNARLAGSDGAEARWAAGGRCGGFAQSCGRCRSFDRGRSDLCSRHPQGSCGRFERVLSALSRIPLDLGTRGLAQLDHSLLARRPAAELYCAV